MKTTPESARFLTFLLAFAAIGPNPATAQPGGPAGTAGAVSIETTFPVAEETSQPFRRINFTGRFTVSRTGPTNHSLSVFVHYGGSAVSGQDYEALPWLVTIPAGSRSIELNVVAIADNVAEPIETVEAQLSQCPPDTHPPLGVPCRQVAIDPARSSARVFVRDDGITTASLEITAPRDGAQFSQGAPVEIECTAIDLDGAITEVDFFAGNTKIGESQIVFIQQPPPGTPIHHSFTWTGAPVGTHVLTTRATSTAGNAVTSAPVSIQVTAGGVPVVSIEATVPETSEPAPNVRIRPGVFTLRRTGSTTGTLRVFLAYRGTATPGSDYEPLPGSVEFPADAASVDLIVGPFEDNRVEGAETVIAEVLPDPSLGPAARYRVDPSQNTARVTIHDQTAPPQPVPEVRIVATDPLAREGGSAGAINTARFTIRRTGATTDPLTVHFEVSGRAENGVDYQRLNSPAVIPAGQQSVVLTVIPIDDQRPEHAESVVVKLLPSTSSPASYTLGKPRKAAAIILDNDRPRPHCARLPDGLFNLCVGAGTNACFRIEASDDLRQWEVLCRVPANEGAAHFVDPDGEDLPRRFYRAIPDVCDP